MLEITIPGYGKISLKYAVFDYNGTLAVDGELITGVADSINALADQLTFHIITADTFGRVKSELEGVSCDVVVIPEKNQAETKQTYVSRLGRDHCLGVGNGRNDRFMLKEAALGVALLQEEGASVETLLAADLVCRDVRDVFAFLQEPRRLIASLRS